MSTSINERVEQLKNRALYQMLKDMEEYVPEGAPRRLMRNTILSVTNKLIEDVKHAYTGKLVRGTGRARTAEERPPRADLPA